MRNTTLFVIAAHLVISLYLLASSPFLEKKPQKKIAVKEFIAKPPSAPKKAAALAPAPHPVPKKSAQKKTPPPPSKQKPQPKPKPAPANKTPTPPAVSNSTRRLIEELEKGIAKIEGERDKVEGRKEIDTPQVIDRLKTTRLEEAPSDDGYAETLIACLRKSLNLPEYGEVKIKLTLRKDGTVEQLAVLKAESTENRRYLEKHLPLLHFPPISTPQETFVLTFCNEV